MSVVVAFDFRTDETIRRCRASLMHHSLTGDMLNPSQLEWPLRASRYELLRLLLPFTRYSSDPKKQAVRSKPEPEHGDGGGGRNGASYIPDSDRRVT